MVTSTSLIKPSDLKYLNLKKSSFSELNSIASAESVEFVEYYF